MFRLGPFHRETETNMMQLLITHFVILLLQFVRFRLRVEEAQ